MRKSILAPIVSGLSLSLILSGCALTHGTKQMVMISTDVDHARVIVDAKPRGTTKEAGVPFGISLARNEMHYVVLQKEGYAPGHETVDNQVNTLGILDIIGAFIFILPVISVITGGAFSLTPSDVYIPLEKLPATQPPTQTQN